MTILKRHYLGQGKVIIWAKLVSKKNNLAQILTIKNCARTFKAETHVYSAFDKHC